MAYPRHAIGRHLLGGDDRRQEQLTRRARWLRQRQHGDSERAGRRVAGHGYPRPRMGSDGVSRVPDPMHGVPADQGTCMADGMQHAERQGMGGMVSDTQAGDDHVAFLPNGSGQVTGGT